MSRTRTVVCSLPMTKCQLAVLAKRICEVVTVFEPDGPYLNLPPTEHTLRGVALERSGGSREFYAWAFFQPLCVFSPHRYFNIGWRLRKGATWHADDPAQIDRLAGEIQAEVVPVLQSIESARDAALTAKRLLGTLGPVSQRAVAYWFARHGDVPQAVRELDRFIEMQRAILEENWDGVEDELSEAEGLRALLLDSPSEAQIELDQWEAKSRKALGVSS